MSIYYTSPFCYQFINKQNYDNMTTEIKVTVAYGSGTMMGNWGTFSGVRSILCLDEGGTRYADLLKLIKLYT